MLGVSAFPCKIGDAMQPGETTGGTSQSTYVCLLRC